MATIHVSGFSQHVHIYLKHNAGDTTLLAKTKNHNSFKEVLRMPSKQLWEHDISQCVAFCFVSTKAAVHRKSLDSLWIAALPMESGTEPGEESWLQLSIMFLDCLFTIKDLLTFTHCSTSCFNFSFKIFYDAVDACICRQNLKFQIVLRFVFLTQQRGVSLY